MKPASSSPDRVAKAIRDFYDNVQVMNGASSEYLLSALVERKVAEDKTGEYKGAYQQLIRDPFLAPSVDRVLTNLDGFWYLRHVGVDVDPVPLKTEVRRLQIQLSDEQGFLCLLQHFLIHHHHPGASKRLRLEVDEHKRSTEFLQGVIKETEAEVDKYRSMWNSEVDRRQAADETTQAVRVSHTFVCFAQQ